MIELLESSLVLLREAFERVGDEGAGFSFDELSAQVDAAQRVINAASAVQALSIAQYAAREEVRGEDLEWTTVHRGLGHMSEFCDGAIGASLTLAPAISSRKVRDAVRLAGYLPATLSAMADGELDAFRAHVIAEELEEADRCVCAQVEEQVFPKVLTQTAGRVRATVRRVLARVDPDAVRRRAAAAHAERDVRVTPAELGLSALYATVPALEGAKCFAAIDALAHRTCADAPDTPIGQARSDALVDLILGNATVTTTVTVAVPVETMTVDEAAPPDALVEGRWVPDGSRRASSRWLLGSSAGVEVRGVGVIPGDVIAAITSTFGTTIARALTDSRTGIVLETGTAAYRPPAKVSGFVKLRDGTCRFPGCAVRAERCDGDHVVPWPVGATAPANLVSLCRRHHRLKHQTRWRLAMTGTGVCTWTSPTGDQYVTHPVDFRDALAS